MPPESATFVVIPTILKSKEKSKRVNGKIRKYTIWQIKAITYILLF